MTPETMLPTQMESNRLKKRALALCGKGCRVVGVVVVVWHVLLPIQERRD